MLKHRFTVKKPEPVATPQIQPHHSWSHRQGRFASLVLPDPDFESEVDCLKEDIGIVNFDAVVRRCRPYPYDPGQVFNIVAGVGANNFSAYAQLIPVGTFNFGDSPNRVQLIRLNIELMSANDTFVLEFAKSIDGVTFTVLGATRFRRGAGINRTFPLETPCRPFNNDANALYARLKSALGGNNVTFSLCVARFIPTEYKIPASTGTWPFG